MENGGEMPPTDQSQSTDGTVFVSIFYRRPHCSPQLAFSADSDRRFSNTLSNTPAKKVQFSTLPSSREWDFS